MNKHINKNNYKIKTNTRVDSMIGEKLASKLSAFLIAITILMLLGLLHSSGPMRGFPIPWVFNMQQIIPNKLISSLVIVSAAVIAASAISRIYVRIKEPKLIAYNKSPKLASNYADTIEMSQSVPAQSRQSQLENTISEVNEALESINRKREIKAAQEKLRNHRNLAGRESNDNGNKVVAIIIVVILMTFFFIIGVISELFYNYDNDWDIDEINLDAGDEELMDEDYEDLTEEEILELLEMDIDEEEGSVQVICIHPQLFLKS